MTATQWVGCPIGRFEPAITNSVVAILTYSAARYNNEIVFCGLVSLHQLLPLFCRHQCQLVFQNISHLQRIVILEASAHPIIFSSFNSIFTSSAVKFRKCRFLRLFAVDKTPNKCASTESNKFFHKQVLLYQLSKRMCNHNST